jgi:ankyrin repeat protein
MRPRFTVGVLLLQILAALLASAAARASSNDAATSRLMIGILSGNVAMVRSAIDEGADVNANTGEGRTPLIVAAMSTHPDAVKLLLERGADPSRKAEDPAIGNALTAAFFSSNGTELTGLADEPDARKHEAALEVLRLLAATQADRNLLVRRASTNMTVLMIAARWGALDATQILLKAGADPNAKNIGKLTALDFATEGTSAASRVPTADRAAIVSAIQAAGGRRGAGKP